MSTFATAAPELKSSIGAALRALRAARADGDPQHNEQRCGGCLVCIRERHLNRLLDRIPLPPRKKD